MCISFFEITFKTKTQHPLNHWCYKNKNTFNMSQNISKCHHFEKHMFKYPQFQHFKSSTCQQFKISTFQTFKKQFSKCYVVIIYKKEHFKKNRWLFDNSKCQTIFLISQTKHIKTHASLTNQNCMLKWITAPTCQTNI